MDLSYIVRDFSEIMEKLAPLNLAFQWDNVGLQIGDPVKLVKAVLVTLTVTQEVVEKAIANNVDLIIAHHPVIFKPLYHIRTDQHQEALISTIIKNDLAVYVAHTNLDQASEGLNSWLAESLGLQDTKVLVPSLGEGVGVGLGRVGTIPTQSLGKLVENLESVLDVRIKVIGDSDQNVNTVAVLGGSGGDFITNAKEAGADVMITGDVSYHDALDAIAMGMVVLDAGHFATEQIMVSKVAKYLRKHFDSQLKVFEETSVNPFRF